MTDDSLEFEELETLTAQPTVTAWSSQVASRAKSIRTYGRRGSTGALPRSSQCKPQMRFKPSRTEQALDSLSPTDEEQEFGQIADIENRSLPVFRLDIPKLPGRKRFTRAHSMDVGSNEPDPYPVLRRSASVSLTRDHSSSTSARSSSISSYMDSYSDEGPENIHPNMYPLEELVSPKRCGRPTEVRGRKKVRSAKNLTTMEQAPLDSISSSASFSNLAREESLTWAKAAPPKRPPTLAFNELEFLEYSSPAMSSVCSNRKRGICDSPFDDLDDCQSVGSLSVSRRSWMVSSPTHPIGEFHSESVPSQKLNLCSQDKAKCSKTTALMEIASDDGDSGVDSKGDMDSDDEVSLDGNPNRRSPMPTFVPFDQRQTRRSSVPIFPQEAIARQVIHPGTASVDDVINSIPSYNDLKYLVMRLRGQPDRCVCWHVALPNTWGETQRRAFILWITNTLGFTYRKAGAQAAYFQIPKSKGASILRLLEFAMETCKERGIGTKSPTNANAAATHLNFGVTPIQNINKTTNTRITPVGLNVTTSGNRFLQATDYLDPELMKGLDALGMDDKPPIAKSATAQKISIVLDDDCEVSLRDPRDSLENHSSSRDLMAHMHGLTPIDTHYRPPRLSTGAGSIQGTINKFNIASPYPQPIVNSIACQSKGFSNDFVATPMMKPAGWGSCPIDGRDWGISEGCDERVSQTLFRMLELACHEAGYSGEEAENLGAETRCFALELELEAASEYRIGESSPESSSDKDGSEEGGLFYREDRSDSSPPSRSGHEGLVDELGAQPNLLYRKSKAFRRRQTEFDKRTRLSLFAAAVNPTASIFGKRKSLFQRPTLSQLIDSMTSPRLKVLVSEHKFEGSIQSSIGENAEMQPAALLKDECILKSIFLFLSEPELLRSAFLVCTTWADAATQAHAELMCIGVGCNALPGDGGSDEDNAPYLRESITRHSDKPWNYLTSTFPWARFLAEGGFKQVYQVFNRSLRAMEAVSVMDIEALRESGELNIVGAELAVSVMLSSLVRRGVCPNFVVTRGAFSSVYKPPAKLWGSENNRNPNGITYQSPVNPRKIRQPKEHGRYQYIRMELCEYGDAEEFIKTLPDEMLDPEVARKLFFQMAFALHTAAERFSLKHYDVKLLNYFIQTMKSDKSGDIVLRYCVGDFVFALRSPRSAAFLAKLADYGTANVDSATNGQQVTIAQFTTLENTPVDFLLLGDNACQGHGHDSFGLGLCMLHLFTGHAPYEEILEKVTCPPNLKERLRNLWECEDEEQYSVIRGVILSNVVKDEEGHILEGEPNDILYDTLYRFLVLFGIPDLPAYLRTSKVWCVVKECLEGHEKPRGRTKRGKNACDIDQYILDCRKYSIDRGTDKFIKRARLALASLDGGMDLLKSLVSFDPITRSTALDVLNSKFMEPLREASIGVLGYTPDDDLRTFACLSTKYES